MNILITAPSLNPDKNVSGVSSVANTIIYYNKQHKYFHYLLGRPDEKLTKLTWLLQLVKQIVLFPIVLRKQKIDLVHQNLPFDPKGLMRESIINYWCWLLKTPVFLHVHGGVFLMNGTSNKFYLYLSKKIFQHSKVVVVLSELEKEAVATKYNYTESFVLMNSVDVLQFDSIKKGNVVTIKPTILFLGRIHESKGVNDIIEAFRVLKKEIDFRFILCGDGPLRELFASECSEILGADFEYRGVVSGNDKLKVIEESDFFLLPSRYGEGLPMALLETMAAGLVPVVTDDASMKFVVQHNVTGIRVEKNNPLDIYLKLKQIIQNRELYALISKKASQTISEQYNIDNYVIQLNEIYKMAITK